MHPSNDLQVSHDGARRTDPVSGAPGRPTRRMSWAGAWAALLLGACSQGLVDDGSAADAEPEVLVADVAHGGPEGKDLDTAASFLSEAEVAKLEAAYEATLTADLQYVEATEAVDTAESQDLAPEDEAPLEAETEPRAGSERA